MSQEKPGRLAVTLVGVAVVLAVALVIVAVCHRLGLGDMVRTRPLYAALALVASFFYGWFARPIFTSKEAEDKRDWPDIFPYKAHQFWLNFAGSMVGWVLAWKLRHFVTGDLAALDVRYALLAFLAFLGVTGWLPYTAVGVAQAFAELAKRLSEVVKK